MATEKDPEGRVRALVLSGFGLNCEVETAAAFRLAGGEAEVVHLNRLLRGEERLDAFDLLALPGGFSFGDDLGSGQVLAGRLVHGRLPSGRRMVDEIGRFLGDGKLIIGICNGFQVLVKTGLLPGLGQPAPDGLRTRTVSLDRNLSDRFEDRWVRLRVTGRGNEAFFRGIDRIELPVRHGEGRLVFADEDVRQAVLSEGLGCLAYVDEDGEPTEQYPDNPNGAQGGLAALTDPSGQILGMMPHPEAFLSLYNHPNWPARKRQAEAESSPLSEDGDGLKIFQNAVRWLSQERPERA